MRVTTLHIHPVKSCAGLAVEVFDVDRRGPAGDRRWMVIDERGRFVSAREHPALLLVRPTPTTVGLTLAAPGRPELTVGTPGPDAPTVPVSVWQDATTAGDAGDAAARWFSAYLGRPCRLVHQRLDDRREIGTKTGAAPGDEASFADGYPLLLIGTASLAALNGRLASPVTMDRFRPNLVVETAEPFVEDRWETLRIGDLAFTGAKRCARCVLTTVDPASGEKDPGGEPMQTLRAFRFDREARGILFGMNLIPRGNGRLAVGDLVRPGTG